MALLGASPGASTAAFIAIGVLQKCFAGELKPRAWLPKLQEMIPSYGISLIDDTARSLKIEDVNLAPMRTEGGVAAVR
jgi:malate dehydrogenase (quinone)